MTLSTVAKGDDLRDRVAGWLRAAGHVAVETEKYINGKTVDVYFEEVTLRVTRYAVECKNWDSPLSKSDITKILNDYSVLERAKSIDCLIIINPRDLGTHARQVIAATPWATYYTWNSFKTKLINFDSYLRRLINESEQYQPSEYYVQPYTTDGHNLETTLEAWLDETNAPPVAILATYGMGKTTFANHFAARLAQRCLKGEVCRIPILLRLGDLVAEQDLDGLLGKLFTRTYQVGNFRYDVFRQLNDEGHLLIIADGFDEMKRSLDTYQMRHNFEQLYDLCRGSAKFILLGRPTVFLTDEERTFFLRGGVSLGDAVETEDFKPAFREIGLKGFSDDDVKIFIRGYLVHQRRKLESDYHHVDDQFIERRIVSLADNRVSALAQRPVHAQMLARLFTSKDFELEAISEYELYDKFVKFMASREQKKAARSSLSLEDRVRFERHLAWWHWRNARTNLFRASEIPSTIVRIVKPDRAVINQALQRDLLVGSVLEVTGDEFRFPHRSFAEFFVAQYIIFEGESEENLATRFRYLNSEILSFISQWKKMSPVEGRRLISEWYEDLGRQRGKINLLALEFISNDEELSGRVVKEFDEGSIESLGRLPFFHLFCCVRLVLNKCSTTADVHRASRILLRILRSGTDGFARAAAVIGLMQAYIILLVNLKDSEACVDLCQAILIETLNDKELADSVQSVREGRSYTLNRATSGRVVLDDGKGGFVAGAFLRSVTPFEKENRERAVKFSLAGFVNNIIGACSKVYGIEGIENFGRQASYEFPVQYLLREVYHVRADLLRTIFTSRVDLARLVVVERR